MSDGGRGFGLVRFRSTRTVEKVMQAYKNDEIVVQDVAVVIKPLTSDKIFVDRPSEGSRRSSTASTLVQQYPNTNSGNWNDDEFFPVAAHHRKQQSSKMNMSAPVPRHDRMVSNMSYASQYSQQGPLPELIRINLPKSSASSTHSHSSAGSMLMGSTPHTESKPSRGGSSEIQADGSGSINFSASRSNMRTSSSETNYSANSNSNASLPHSYNYAGGTGSTMGLMNMSMNMNMGGNASAKKQQPPGGTMPRSRSIAGESIKEGEFDADTMNGGMICDDAWGINEHH